MTKKIVLVKEEVSIKVGDQKIVEKRDDAAAIYSLFSVADYKQQLLNDNIREVIKVKKKLVDLISEDKDELLVSENEYKALQLIIDSVKKSNDTRIPYGVAVAFTAVEDAIPVKEEE